MKKESRYTVVAFSAADDASVSSANDAASIGSAVSLRLRNVQSHRDQFIAAPAVPTPPEHLRGLSARRGDASEYLRRGHVMARSVHELLRSRTISVSEGARVLDFGCGAGCATTWLHARHADWKLYGSDQDAEAIAWAQSNLANVGRFDCNLPIPPLSYWDGYFDLVIALSTFTQPDNELQSAWFEELVRVTRGGGHLVVAVRKPGASEVPRGGEARFLWNADQPMFYRAGHLATDFIRRAWGKFVRIEQVIPRSMGSDCALVICRK